MNYISIVKKHLKALESAYGQIKGVDVRKRAYDEVWAFWFSIQTAAVGETTIVDSGTTITAEIDASGGVLSVGEVSVPPIEENAPKAVEMVGSWPVEAEVEIVGLAPNRRSLKGRLGDGRIVGVERTLKAWKSNDQVRAKLVQGGSCPLFRAIA